MDFIRTTAVNNQNFKYGDVVATNNGESIFMVDYFIMDVDKRACICQAQIGIQGSNFCFQTEFDASNIRRATEEEKNKLREIAEQNGYIIIC
jgi:hypothetical protein